MTILLPWPPSTNHTWQKGNGRVFLSAQTRTFRKAVASIVLASRMARPALGALEVRVTLYPPDKRRRDADNFAGKALFDALTLAGVWADDSQVRKQVTTWGDVVKGGAVTVQVLPME